MGKRKMKRTSEGSINNDCSASAAAEESRSTGEGPVVAKKRIKRSDDQSPNRSAMKRGCGQTRYWIEDCPDSTPNDKRQGAVTVVVTRVSLSDNFFSAPPPLRASSNTVRTLATSKDALLDLSTAPFAVVANSHVEHSKPSEIESLASHASHAPNNSAATEITAVAGVEASDRRGDHAASLQINRAAEPTSESAIITTTTTPTLDDKEINHDNRRQPFITIIRAPSAKLNNVCKALNSQWNSTSPSTTLRKKFVHLKHGDCGDGIVNPHPTSEVDDKYWAQRRRLFTRFDEGITLDKESWYSVTPEVIADHIAKRMIHMISMDVSLKQSKRGVILDAFCGCGGNAIAFAKSGNASLVVCIDLDRSKLRMAANNASIYGIASDDILFIEADAILVLAQCYTNGILNPSFATTVDDDIHHGKDVEVCKGYKIGGIQLLPPFVDAIFLSPPWGGMDYQKSGKRNYDLASCIKVNTTYIAIMNRKDNNGFFFGDANTSVVDTSDAMTNDEKRIIINGEELLSLAFMASNENKRVVYFLPRNTNGILLGRSALKSGYTTTNGDDEWRIEMEQNVLHGKLKTITAYFGMKQNYQ